MTERVTVPAEDGITNTPADNAKTDSQDRPEWLPEKFKTPEDMAKSYRELERKLSGGGSKPTADEAFDDPKGGPGDKHQQDAPNADDKEVESVSHEQAKQLLPGFSSDEINEISNYAWENRSLSEEHYAKLEKAGYSKEIVDQFMSGQFAVAEGAQQALLNAGGGAENVEAMFSWAAENLDQKTIDTYNSKFDAGGADALMAMENLKAKFEASGYAPTGQNVSGANAPFGSGDVFRSVAQVTEAMQDPRYKTDPAYRKDVEQKLARSKVF